MMGNCVQRIVPVFTNGSIGAGVDIGNRINRQHHGGYGIRSTRGVRVGRQCQGDLSE